MKCSMCESDKELTSSSITYRYKDCGLDNVILHGVKESRCEECGEFFYNFSTSWTCLNGGHYEGLSLWLSGIGRPTRNARTERAIGTLKREEINLQDHYTTEDEARSRIGAILFDYNFRRPNAGNGGFSPN